MGVAAGSFLIFAAAQVGTPGPANLALMATGARHGLGAALPFVAGVVLGKQLLIWPMGFGLLAMSARAPYLFDVLKWASAGYIIWLAWRVANARLALGDADGPAPGFAAGLLLQPLNPKAWAMITAGFTQFVSVGTPILQASATIAICLLLWQTILHPMWAFAGARVAAAIAGDRAEKYLMWSLAALTVASVLYVLFGGGKA